MNRRILAVDAAIAVAIALFVLIVTPGVAVAGMLALLVIIICAVSFIIDARRARARPAGSRPVRRRPPPSRRTSRGR